MPVALPSIDSESTSQHISIDFTIPLHIINHGRCELTWVSKTSNTSLSSRPAEPSHRNRSNGIGGIFSLEHTYHSANELVPTSEAQSLILPVSLVEEDDVQIDLMGLDDVPQLCEDLALKLSLLDFDEF